MGKKTYVEGLFWFVRRLHYITSEVDRADHPKDIEYTITMLLDLVNRLQKFRDEWVKKTARAPFGRYAAMRERKEHKTKADKELMEFEMDLWRKHLDEHLY